ncbi:hypothetical protein MTR64_05675 [Novosphingobium sp. 2580]|uniref:Uncharacterized protein n=1 Tax=Novosphingobium album (ex Hu et al. 2023) TaxID=2930093 RepID=A0ABT0AZB4_9SPHN|nr:hypothetical protein [Novosphingobium album (ex Hu et al. 2023)]MCJ2178044.1 hypothetical protein [Novosphingobium album (ex Hu et al. 2023)]
MVRNLHIERQDEQGKPDAITLEEWAEAVDHIEGVRMAKGDAEVANPLTKEIVVLPNRGGDAEVFREDCHRWLRALFWTPDGAVRFAEPGMAGDPIVPLACQLADELHARVCDDRGEAITPA